MDMDATGMKWVIDQGLTVALLFLAVKYLVGKLESNQAKSSAETGKWISALDVERNERISLMEQHYVALSKQAEECFNDREALRNKTMTLACHQAEIRQHNLELVEKIKELEARAK